MKILCIYLFRLFKAKIKNSYYWLANAIYLLIVEIFADQDHYSSPGLTTKLHKSIYFNWSLFHSAWHIEIRTLISNFDFKVFEIQVLSFADIDIEVQTSSPTTSTRSFHGTMWKLVNTPRQKIGAAMVTDAWLELSDNHKVHSV